MLEVAREIGVSMVAEAIKRAMLPGSSRPAQRVAPSPILQSLKIQAVRARSLTEIADALNARGVPTARGASWAPMTVKRVLDRAG